MRIITGTAKGLKLKTPAGYSTRPTSDRVKESLFSVLTSLIDFSEVSAVLDIFAGTGALGLESLSRGAHFATFIDSTTTDVIAENVRRAKFESVTKIFRGDFIQVLKKISRQEKFFDLIFSDPPYKKGFSQMSLKIVDELNLMNDAGIFVAEHGADEVFHDIPQSFNLLRKINYGHTTSVEIFQKVMSGD